MSPRPGPDGREGSTGAKGGTAVGPRGLRFHVRALPDALLLDPPDTPMPHPPLRPLLVAGLAAAVLLPSPAPAAAQGLGPEIGTDLPDFTLTDLVGNEVEIRQVVEPNKPAVIEIWATWCTICRALQPQMEAIVESHGDEVSVVAIAVAINQTREDVAQHVERFGHDWPFLYDGSGNAVRALDAGATGIVLMVDRDGKIAYTGTGRSQDLLAEVEKLLGER